MRRAGDGFRSGDQHFGPAVVPLEWLCIDEE
jgi:hypothetical protein